MTAIESKDIISGQMDLEKELLNIRLVVFDFDGVFTDNMVYVFENGSEAVRCFRGDGIGLTRLKKIGMDIIILSTEPNPVVTQRSKKIGIRCVQGCDDKLNALKDIAEELGLSLDQIAFVGNDINDVECLKSVGFPVAVADAEKEIMPFVRYFLTRRGGEGAVREFCDIIYEAKTRDRKYG